MIFSGREDSRCDRNDEDADSCDGKPDEQLLVGRGGHCG
jgi:hypothetical protein